MTLALPGFEAPCDLALSQYDTPPVLAAALCGLVEVRGATVLEPSAGRGNVVAAALSAGAERVVAIELDPVRCGVLRDRFAREIAAGRVEVIEQNFLTVSASAIGRFGVIVGNPPYDDGADTEHVAHMLSLAEPGADLALLLRTVFLHGQERSERVWPRVRIRALEPVSARVKFGAESGKIDVSLFHLELRDATPLDVDQDVVVRFR